jgi:hypothetical protein
MTLVLKGRKLDRRRTFQGMDISVENQCGSFRCWKDPHAGTEGRTLMRYDYGYIRGTRGTDGDHVDVYVGSNKLATHAYVITQMKAPLFIEVDEQKVMLGFDSAAEAEAAYRLHYDNPGFFGMIQAMPMGEFRAAVMNKNNHGQLVKSEDGSLCCPHCSVTVFRSVGNVLKARVNIVVLHKADGRMEINCNVCRQAVYMPANTNTEAEDLTKARAVLTLGGERKGT